MKWYLVYSVLVQVHSTGGKEWTIKKDSEDARNRFQDSNKPFDWLL